MQMDVIIYTNFQMMYASTVLVGQRRSLMYSIRMVDLEQLDLMILTTLPVCVINVNQGYIILLFTIAIGMTLGACSRVHIDIQRFFWPPRLKNWFADNFIQEVYGNYSLHISDVMIHNTQAFGRR